MPSIFPEDLTKKTCRPCEGGEPSLPAEDVARLSGSVPGWVVEESKKLKREFRFKDFAGSMAFVNRIAAIAESQNHHPAIFISYNVVRVTLSTHAINGLSENDFIMAARISEAQTQGGTDAR